MRLFLLTKKLWKLLEEIIITSFDPSSVLCLRSEYNLQCALY